MRHNTSADIPLGLTFDDVLLVPKRSPIISRKDVDLRTRLSRSIVLGTPIVSANMDTVTEAPMAIAVAHAGGIGIIHRFLSIEDQVREVAKVKRSQNVIIEDPYTLPESASVAEARAVMAETGSSGLLVINESRELVGIVTNRDMAFAHEPEKRITEVMTPKNRLVTAPPDISLHDAELLLHKHRLEKLPLVDAQFHIHGLITMRDIQKRKEFPLTAKDQKGRLLVGAAVGVKDDYIERAQALTAAGADVLVLDIAHGHSDVAINAISSIRKTLGKVELIAGNVATAEGTEELIAAGVDAVKVGVGAGSMCTTRIVTGSGVPQLTTIINCAEVADKHDIPVIADGGLRTSGDIVKALAAGASSIMAGWFFAGTTESPGRMMIRNGQKVKVYQGSASLGSVEQRSRRMDDDADEERFRSVVPEGVETVVPYRGDVGDIIHQLLGGLRSGMSYSGARNLAELRANAEFIRMTNAGLHESIAHGAKDSV